jgi:hypothetical protein
MNTARDDEMRAELVVKHVVTHTSGPPGKPLPLVTLREFSRAMLRGCRMPVPEDAWLDEFILEMAEWHEVAVERTTVVEDIRRLILDLELRPRQLLLTREKPASDDDAIGHERERRVRIVLRELQVHGLTVHNVCSGWMLPPAPESTFGLDVPDPDRETGT